MSGDGGRIEVGLRCRFGIEVSEGIPPTDEGCRVTHLELADVGRDVTQGEADAPVTGGVRSRGMGEQDMMQGHFAAFNGTSTPAPSGTSTAISWPRLSRLFSSNVSRCLSCFLRWLPGQNLMAPLSTGGIGKGNPRGDDLVGAEAPVGSVLVPRHEGRRARLLDEEGAAPAEDVGTDQILHRIEDGGMTGQIVRPGEQKMHLVPHVAGDRRARGPFMVFEPAAIRSGVLGGHHANGEVETVVAIACDLVGRETPGHGTSSCWERRLWRPFGTGARRRPSQAGFRPVMRERTPGTNGWTVTSTKPAACRYPFTSDSV